MNIYAPKGTKVRFLNFNGQDWEREKAATVFDTEKEYTVDHTDVGNWSTDVYFEEVAGPWNSVMFLEVGEELPDYIKKARGLDVDEDDEECCEKEEAKHIPEVVVRTHFDSIETEARNRNMTVDELIAEFAHDESLTVKDFLENEDINDYLCGGDYREVSITIDGTEMVRYGDHYHDKGRDKAEGFVDGLTCAYGEILLSHEYVADYEG